MSEAIERELREARDRAYSDYIHQMLTPECLGFERKLKDGHFGEAELKAHTKAGELLGRHRAFAEVLERILSRSGQPPCHQQTISRWQLEPDGGHEA